MADKKENPFQAWEDRWNRLLEEDAKQDTSASQMYKKFIIKTASALSIDQLAHISDKALDDAYHYGRSTPGQNFGWLSNMESAKAAKSLIDAGITDIEQIADAIHDGWNTTAKSDGDGSLQLDTPTPAEKKAKRMLLAEKDYASLPEDEKEKDRVVARALLESIKGK